jgi:serine/threonine-protein kinase RsbW
MITQVSKQIQIPNRLSCLHHIRRAIRIFLNNDVNEIWQFRIVLCLDEAISNIIEHGFPLYRQSKIYLSLNKDDIGYTFILTDDAVEFTPSKNSLEKLQRNYLNVSQGFGLIIIHSIMEVQYTHREGGGNILILKKSFSDMD